MIEAATIFEQGPPIIEVDVKRVPTLSERRTGACPGAGGACPGISVWDVGIEGTSRQVGELQN